MRTLGVTLAMVLGLVACGGESARSTLSIATGGPAGLYYPMGGGMASIWSASMADVNVKAEVTGGSVTNVIQVARGESDFGIAMADVVTDAYAGTGRFPRALPLRILANAYPNIVHILTLQGSGIDTVAQMAGRRVSLGAAGSGTAVAAINVLESLGVTLDQIAPAYLSFAETTSALKDGTIDAGFVVGGLGLAAVTELSVTRDLQLVALSEADVEQINDNKSAYTGYIIPAGTYNGVEHDVRALGIWSAVVVHQDMDEGLAYRLVCTLFAHRDELMRVSPVAGDMSVENLARVPAVPLHPGTRRYLEHVAGGQPPDCADGV